MVKSTTIRMDENLKRETVEMLDSLGLSFNTYVTMASRQLVTQRRVPFSIVAPAYEPTEETRKAAQKDPACVTVRIVNGDCYVRSAPNTANVPLGVARRGSEYPYQGQTDNGWHLIEWERRNAWVSGTYSEVE